MPRFRLIGKLLWTHRFQLALTYTLFGLEMLGTLLRPFFLGEAVNDLIQHSYRGLIILSATHLVWIIVGTIRHAYDTRTYSAIYTALVTRVLSRKFDSSEVSRLSAHSTLAREFIDFLEYDLNYLIEAIYNLLGSLILLQFYDSRVVLLCLAVLVPVMLISYFYGKRMNILNQKKNDELERQVSVIESGEQEKIKEHYLLLRKWQIKISDQEAWNFGVLELLVLITLTCSLWITSKDAQAFMVGDIVGMYYYILKFASGLDTIPYLVQRVSSLQDIARRVELEEEDLIG